MGLSINLRLFKSGQTRPSPNKRHLHWFGNYYAYYA